MKRTPVQSELPLKRARVQPIEETDVVSMRVRTDVAAAVTANPAGAEQALADGLSELKLNAEALIGYTSWHEEGGAPPFSGYWDLKVRGVRSDFKEDSTHRVWFDKEADMWHIEPALIPSSVVLADFVWRGLAAPWPMGYTYRVGRLRVVSEG